MTTIAWDGTTLAADRCSWTRDIRRAVCKLHRFEDGIYASCGDEAMVTAFAAFKRGEAAMPNYEHYAVEKNNTLGLFIDWKGIANIVTLHGYLLPYPREPFFAYGAGQEFAWGALEMGATAKQAVEIAAKRSDYAGMGVDEMTLDA